MTITGNKAHHNHSKWFDMQEKEDLPFGNIRISDFRQDAQPEKYIG